MTLEKVTIFKEDYFKMLTRTFYSNLESEDLLVRYLKAKEHIYLYKISRRTRLMNSKKYKIKFEYGIPDFYYKKDGKIVFVECKLLPNDGLRYPQFKWIMNHPEYLVRVIFIKIKEKRVK